MQFQDELKVQPKTFGFIGLNGNSFIGDVGFKLLEDVFFSYSLNYNFRKKPLADFQVKNGVSFNIAVGYSFIFRK